MVSDYDPAVLVLIFCAAMAANVYMTPQTKLSTIFVLQSVVFSWFLFHFVHSVI
ncbi:IMV membrane protein [Bovine papular stomatitis virus]|uniref:IMV membrane protein n=1 Tax=Bovine papular stomatitis virus TaxID=129727 RepID=Q6TV97_9POXV|nr:ORF091 IMV membrane protein [Bovine papular stomatitis virus]AAR98448.1 ORF091 IMV membrane protein [Bovine papular stomatitis virus]AKC03260.1 IMV membrane protein [Bovine papular stomatitis virus]AKC03389.1 IMV membrane protein [Bovine papular stomatitis virus]AKC03517.1 IMV membrane protein [Bovine papular stomatitis virus]